MKRKTFSFVVGFMIVVAAAGAYHTYLHNSAAEDGDLLMANVEALADGDVSASNTGPGTPFKCNGGGQGKWCLCTNSHPCTETPC
ncbi:NVEALA domain-containing protein [Xylanibacter rodentium]|jgi:hypothetical protein|uniref:NVEALA family protein n=2 Tax=Bacteroidales TaxID=171549 RepID=A0ABX2AUZ6_9BACT|nr:NVEALA domain-containing protein [Xylanibacter rodentium]NPE10505.1 hypothetical protein [Prevotella sp. PJ1A]NPE14592.1 hypothetical protein [Xylanibacter rodentium]NPE37976.1 hypothetical protein [Prevotella sp. PCJ2]